ncbi:MAG: hypothetical protein AMXMBFR12_02970 [Candidatus Babeliales bacterium]
MVAQTINKYKSTKLFWIFIWVGIGLTLTSIGFWLHCYRLSTQVVEKVGKQFLQYAEKRKVQILDYIETERQSLSEFTQDPHIINLAELLTQYYMPGAIGDYKTTSEEYKNIEKQLDQLISQQNSTYQFKDIMFIEPSGKIYYTFKNNMINVDLVSSRSYTTNLAQSFARTRMTLTTDISEFSIDPELNAPALYMLHPLFKDGILIAIVAIQLDEDIIYKIIQNYEGLGQTGDIFVTKNIADRVIFVAPSRLYSNVAFKKITDPSKEEKTPTRLGTSGKLGYGYLIDTYNIPVIAAWRFIPQVNLGIAISIHYSEASASLWWYRFFCWFFGILLLIYVGIFVYFLETLNVFHRFKNAIFSLIFLKLILWTMSLSILLISAFLFWHRYNSYEQIVDQTITLAQSKVYTEVESIQQNLNEVEKITAMIAQDLKSGALKREDIQIRIQRDLKEFPDLENITVTFAPFAYDPQQRLYGFEAKKINGNVEYNPTTYDYLVKGASTLAETDWYNKAIKEGAGWSEIEYDKNQETRILYMLPFYLSDKPEPAGVIAVTYNLGKVIEGVKRIEIGKTGYGTLLSNNGMFIYHPLAHYIKNQLSLADLARESNNPQLSKIAQQMFTRTSGIFTYTDQSNNPYWLVYKKVPGINWYTVITFSSESLPIQIAKLRKQLIWAIISLVVGFLFLAMILGRVWQGIIGIKRWAILSVVLLATTLITFWNFTRMTPYEFVSGDIVVRDQTALDKYLALIDIEAQQRNEKRPIALPTGIILYSVNFPDSNKVSLSGYLWQKIKKDLNIKPGLLFPEALDSTFKEIFRKTENDIETIGWKISATFLQKHRYSFFPFDKVHIDIILAPYDFENNVILTPDFGGYKSYDVDPLPGITNKIDIPGYYLDRSFFSFSVLPIYDEVGLDALRKVTEKIRLHYNVILKRKLINPLIIFMLPLLIILFSIFAIFLVTQRWKGKFDAYRSLGAYTGLFFSLVILHQTLRNQVQSGEPLYIEYFFFFTYVTILLLVLHALLLRISTRANIISDKISPYLKILFWPLQFMLWFAITMIIFYSVR